MAWPFVSAGAHAPHSDEMHDPTPSRGASHSARRLRSLAFLGSSNAKLNTKIKGFVKLRFLGLFLRSLLINRQLRRRAFQVGEHHYDIGNDVYAAMLDLTMSYSCGYWKDAANLE